MTEQEQSKTGAGVQNLVDRIRDQGVFAANEKADKIIRDAEIKSAKMLADARREIEKLREDARIEIEANHAAALEALKLSARDTVLQLKSTVSKAFEGYVRQLVTSATRDEQFIKTLVLVLASHVQKELIAIGGREGPASMRNPGDDINSDIRGDCEVAEMSRLSFTLDVC